jgi:hypothetical protein
MKYLIFTLALISTPALAADNLSLSLSANEEQVLVTALHLFDGRQVVVHDELGHDKVVSEPYDLDNRLRRTIAHDIVVLNGSLDEFRAAAKGIPAQKINDLADTKAKIELLSLDVAYLKLDVNPYPPSMLAALAPICPACLGGDFPGKPK